MHQPVSKLEQSLQRRKIDRVGPALTTKPKVFPAVNDATDRYLVQKGSEFVVTRQLGMFSGDHLSQKSFRTRAPASGVLQAVVPQDGHSINLR
jgi:hypothetical protein